MHIPDPMAKENDTSLSSHPSLPCDAKEKTCEASEQNTGHSNKEGDEESSESLADNNCKDEKQQVTKEASTNSPSSSKSESDRDSEHREEPKPECNDKSEPEAHETTRMKETEKQVENVTAVKKNEEDNIQQKVEVEGSEADVKKSVLPEKKQEKDAEEEVQHDGMDVKDEDLASDSEGEMVIDMSGPESPSSRQDDGGLVISDIMSLSKTNSTEPEPVSSGTKRDSSDLSVPAAKRSKSGHGERATQLNYEISDTTSVEMIEGLLSKLRREVRALDLMAKQKERVWNNLLRLRKQKEETFLRLRRKREVMLMMQLNPAARPAKTALPVAQSLPQAPPPSIPPPPPYGAQTQHPVQILGSTPMVMLPTATTHLMASSPAITTASESHLLQMSKQKPILPKPTPPVTVQSGPIQSSTSSQGRMGPQGPTISVKQLIEAHRARNPLDPPRRGRRPRYLPDQNSSGSSSPAHSDSADVQVLPKTNDTNLSYKDVLVQFAQLSKSQPTVGGNPEVSLIPVGEPRLDPSRPPHPEVSIEPTRDNSTHNSSLAKLLLDSKKQAKEESNASLSLSDLLTNNKKVQPQPRVEEEEKEEAPQCQGCHRKAAQFVCAGCGSQWYCSRECQVAAWDDHAEQCSG